MPGVISSTTRRAISAMDREKKREDIFSG